MSNVSTDDSKLRFAVGIIGGMSSRESSKCAGVVGQTGARMLKALAEKCDSRLRRVDTRPDSHQLEAVGDRFVALAIDRSSSIVTAYGVGDTPEDAIAASGATGTGQCSLVPFVKISRPQARHESFVRNMTAIWSCYWNFCRVHDASFDGPMSNVISVHKSTCTMSTATHHCLNQRSGFVGTESARRSTLCASSQRVTTADFAANVLGLKAPRVIEEHDVNQKPLEPQTKDVEPEMSYDARSMAMPEKVTDPDDDRLSIRDLARIIGCSTGTIRNRLNEGICLEQIVTRKSLSQTVLGSKHGRLTVVAIDRTFANDPQAIVDCDCGTMRKSVRLKHLLTGAATSCGCAHLELLSHGKAPTHVEIFGEQVPIGVLADLAGLRPVALWSRIRRGLTPEEAAFGRVR